MGEIKDFRLTTKVLIVSLIGIVLCGSVYGIMNDFNGGVQAVQTGSETIDSAKETCPPMEAPEGVEVPVDGIEFSPVASLFADLAAQPSLEKVTVVTVLENFQAETLEYLDSKEVPSCLVNKFEEQVHSALVLFEEDLITQQQLREEVRSIINRLGKSIYYGIPMNLLEKMNIPESLVEKYVEKVAEKKEVEISNEELIEAAEGIASEG